MKKRLMLIFIFILILSTGCTEQSTERIDTMEKRIADLEQQVSDQSTSIYLLEKKNDDKGVLIVSDNMGYSKVGDYLVAISDVEEYLDGCKVYLKIGNPNNVIYRGYTIEARYGRVFDDYFTE